MTNHLSTSKVVLLVLTLAALITLMAAPASRAQNSQSFKVGVITSLSGDYTLGGQLTKRGYDLWARQVNKAGGIKIDGRRYKVKLFYADAQSNPKSGADAAARMIKQNHVDFILGPYSSAVTLGAAPIAEKYQVPMITGSAESPEIWKHHFRFTFGIDPAADLTAKTPIIYLASKEHVKSIYIVGMNDPFSKAVAKGFQKGATQEDLKIKGLDIVPPHSDFSALVSKIKDAHPDIVAVGGEPNGLIDFLKAMDGANFNPKAIVMHYGITDAGFLKAVGKGVGNYTIGLNDWDKSLPYQDSLFGTARQYYQLYKKVYNVAPDYGTAGCSATGQVFGAALKKLQANPPLNAKQRQKLTSILEKIEVKTFFGPVKFAQSGDHYHDNVDLKPMTVQVVDGRYFIVGPKKFQQRELTYPRPTVH